MPDPESNAQAETIAVVSVPSEEFVFRAGDPATSFFIVSTGQVELLRRGEARGRLALLTAGDLCGEDGAFGGQVHSCDARAVGAATLLSIKTPLFAELVRLRPELAAAVIGRTATRLFQARLAGLAMALPSGRPRPGGGAAQPARFVHVESGQQFPLPDGPEIVVGRADRKFTPGIEFSSVDTHRSLSRSHATISRAGDDYQITEQPHVPNGTFVNGVRLSPGVPAAIKDGDEVSFGLIATVFRTT
jgi:CRP-like cAMP-binding protein